MILLLVIPCWMLLLVLVLALCLAARRGELDGEGGAPAHPRGEPGEPSFHRMFTSEDVPASTMHGGAPAPRRSAPAVASR
jgi:hypothetical protein